MAEAMDEEAALVVTQPRSMTGTEYVTREKAVTDALQLVEESRRLIRQSRTLVDRGALDIVRSEETIAEARRILAQVQKRR